MFLRAEQCLEQAKHLDQVMTPETQAAAGDREALDSLRGTGQGRRFQTKYVAVP